MPFDEHLLDLRVLLEDGGDFVQELVRGLQDLRTPGLELHLLEDLDLLAAKHDERTAVLLRLRIGRTRIIRTRVLLVLDAVLVAIRIDVAAVELGIGVLRALLVRTRVIDVGDAVAVAIGRAAIELGIRARDALHIHARVDRIGDAVLVLVRAAVGLRIARLRTRDVNACIFVVADRVAVLVRAAVRVGIGGGYALHVDARVDCVRDAVLVLVRRAAVLERIVGLDALDRNARVLAVVDAVAVGVLGLGRPSERKDPPISWGSVAARQTRAYAGADVPRRTQGVVRAEQGLERARVRSERRVRQRRGSIDFGTDEQLAARRAQASRRHDADFATERRTGVSGKVADVEVHSPRPLERLRLAGDHHTRNDANRAVARVARLITGGHVHVKAERRDEGPVVATEDACVETEAQIAESE